MAFLDNSVFFQTIIRIVSKVTLPKIQRNVGNVTLPHPFILAAGFIKGTGFKTEQEALQAVNRGENIIPGWRTMPSLVGVVEFGSYTRYPRMGNSGIVIWRDAGTHSTQNRVGLKNPGAIAAAAFLSNRLDNLPDVFGINIAVSPGIDDENQEIRDVTESIAAFLERNVYPSWFTLNLSCPNTEDDPENNQTESKTRNLCKAILDMLNDIPLWVKISPTLDSTQYKTLMRVFNEIGVDAVVATNTIAMQAPDDSQLTAGVGGGELYQHALETVALLSKEKQENYYDLDIIACGGIQDATTYQAFAEYDIQAVQYMSALIYRGPLAAALILNDLSARYK